MKRLTRNIFFILSILIAGNLLAQNYKNLYIRVNQVGFLPSDLKTAVIFSKRPINKQNFTIVNEKSGRVVFSGKFEKKVDTYGNFNFNYTIDFSKLKTDGQYNILIGGKKSYPFKIGRMIYNNVVDTLMLFFREQRCGPTHPFLHKACHLWDVVRLIGDPSHPGGVDVTGGWHDAGDYIKFLSTTGFTTYMLMFAYEFDPVKFGFDNNHNGVPDILEEAKIGLDWMLKANYSKYKLITQVQDLRDHEVGWRMPSNDTLRYDRPGFVGMGKNQIGLFAAVMSMASRIWSKKFKSYKLANKYLNAAENLYSIRNNVPNIDSSESGFYQDKTFLGKLALGAIELYITTHKKSYLSDAEMYADSAGSDFWWSWGNINSLADYRIAEFAPRFKKYIYQNLKSFNTRMDSSVFREGLPYSWGTTNSFLGVALQSIL